jgi:mRNA-degrading endonuclease toxin of MazEF toxin-antitoxin module
MPVNCGDVILTYVPNVGSAGGKVRPALIVQSDPNNARLNETIIAAINLRDCQIVTVPQRHRATAPLRHYGTVIVCGKRCHT